MPGNELSEGPGQFHPSRAQVGIGTLIVFIAMVLVASIAGGVLINTAGLLQSKSEQTGQEAQDGVTNRIQVLGVTGEVHQASCTGSGEIVVQGVEQYELPRNADPVCYQVDSGDYASVEDPSPPDLKFNDETVSSIQQSDSFRFIRVEQENSKDQIRVRYKPRAGSASTVLTATPPIRMNSLADSIWLENDGNVVSVWEENDGFDEQIRFSRPSGSVETVEMTVAQSPGSDPIDLSEATITYVSRDTHAELRYTSDTLYDDNFAVIPITDDDEILEGGEKAVIRFSTRYIDDGLQSGDTATISVVASSGTVVQSQIQVPHTGQTEAVRLD